MILTDGSLTGNGLPFQSDGDTAGLDLRFEVSNLKSQIWDPTSETRSLRFEIRESLSLPTFNPKLNIASRVGGRGTSAA
jgi:hypothetical protein